MNHIGFTTVTFKKPLQRGLITFESLFKWGRKVGFNWVEVRDFGPSLSKDEIDEICDLAQKYDLRHQYAWDGSNVGTPQSEHFLKGIENATRFGKNTYSRVVLAPALIAPEKGKTSYSSEDIKILTEKIIKYTSIAHQQGIVLVFENTMEILQGNHGFEELLAAVPGMMMTLDTANSFTIPIPDVSIRWPELRQFVQRWRDRIPYVHLKSSKDGIIIPELAENADFPLPQLLPLLKPDALLCVELPTSDDLNCCLNRVHEGFNLTSSLLNNQK